MTLTPEQLDAMRAFRGDLPPASWFAAALSWGERRAILAAASNGWIVPTKFELETETLFALGLIEADPNWRRVRKLTDVGREVYRALLADQ